MKLIIILQFFFSQSYWSANVKKILITVLGAVGAFWTIIEFTDYFDGSKDYFPRDFYMFWIILAVSVFLSLIINYQRLSYKFTVRGKDINIRIAIGNLFKQKGDIALSTNTTFDTKTKDSFISPNSVQGQLYRYCDKMEHMDAEIENALRAYQVKEILSRTESKTNRYEFGTIIYLNHDRFRSYWIAMADINEYGRPSSSFKVFQESLEKLWNYLMKSGRMERLVLPILGSGKTGINESREKLLKEIIISFIAFSREKKITEELVLCIHPRDFMKHNIDLGNIKKYLEYSCEFLYDNTSTIVTSTGIEN